MSIYDPARDLVAKVKKIDRHLYLIKLKISNACMAASEFNSKSWIWHKRFGHINFQSLRNISRRELAIGLPTIELLDSACSHYLARKHSRAAY